MKHIRAVIIAALALGVFAAAPAGASASVQFEALSGYSYPFEISGKGGGEMGFSTDGANFSCTAPNFAATLSESSAPLTSTSVEDSNCVSGKFKMNGCQLTFRPNSGTVDLGTPGCGPITFGGTPCGGNLTVQPKTGLAATYTNTGSGLKREVTVQINGSGLSWSVPFCGSGSSGTLAAKFTLSAKKFGEQQGLQAWAPGVQDGIVTSGSGFAAQQYPAKVSGSNVSEPEFTIPGTNAKVICKTVTFAGSLSKAGPVSLTPSYEPGGECSMPGIVEKVQVKANSCSIVPTVGGGTSIACSKEGDAITVSAPSYGLTIRFLPSTGSALSYENLGSEYSATVRASGSVSGFKYTCASAFVCGVAGIPTSGENAVMVVDTTLKGAYGE